jgi:transcriptional regulator with XRE-family HTH domain
MCPTTQYGTAALRRFGGVPTLKKRIRIPLKLALLEEGKSQRALAKETRLSESLLSQIVTGRTNPSRLERVLIAEALQRPASQLFDSGSSEA